MHKTDQKTKVIKSRPTLQQAAKRPSVPNPMLKSSKNSDSKSFFQNESLTLCTSINESSLIPLNSCTTSPKLSLYDQSKKTIHSPFDKVTVKKATLKTQLKIKLNQGFKDRLKTQQNDDQLNQLINKVTQLQQQNQILSQRNTFLEENMIEKEKKISIVCAQYQLLQRKYNELSQKYNKMAEDKKTMFRRQVTNYNEEGFTIIKHKQLQDKVVEYESKIKEQEIQLANLRVQNLSFKSKSQESLSQVRGSLLLQSWDLEIDSPLSARLIEDTSKLHSHVFLEKSIGWEQKIKPNIDCLQIAKEEYNKKVEQIQQFFQSIIIQHEKTIISQQKEISDLQRDYVQLYEKKCLKQLNIEMSVDQIKLAQINSCFEVTLQEKMKKIAELQQELMKNKILITNMENKFEISKMKSPEDSELFELNILQIGYSRALRKVQKDLQREKRTIVDLLAENERKQQLIKAFSYKKMVSKIQK